MSSKLKEKGFLVENDFSNEQFSKKVRTAQLEGFNYSVIIGQKEKDGGLVSIRERQNNEKDPVKMRTEKLDSFIDELTNLTENFK